MPCCEFYFNDDGRRKLARAVLVVSGLQILGGIGELILVVYMILFVDRKLKVIEGYNTGSLHSMLISTAGLIIVFSLARAKVAEGSSDPKKRPRFRGHLIPLIIFTMMLMWVVLAAAILATCHTSYAHRVLMSGFRQSMLQYKNSSEVKQTIDYMQIHYGCCGSDSYSDWFHTPWIPSQYVDPVVLVQAGQGSAENFTTDSVPFSCCDPMVQRPCIHSHVMTASKHKEYDPMKFITIYNYSCVDALVDFIEKAVLHSMSITTFTLFGMEWVVVILLRYIQTSIDSFLLKKDKEGYGAGYIIGQVLNEGFKPADLKGDEFDRDELKDINING